MANPYPHLFSPLTLRSVTLRNRIVSTSHGTFMSKNGLPTERIAAYHAARAAGGAGLINVPIRLRQVARLLVADR